MKAVVRSMARPIPRPDVVGEKAPHLVAKGQVFGAEREVHCTSPRGWRPLRLEDQAAYR